MTLRAHQSPNDLFHASSFMQGHNAEYLEQLYAQYANDPNAVDAAWAEFFRQMGDAELDVKAEAKGPSWARGDWPPHAPNDDLTGALTGEWPAPASRGQGRWQEDQGQGRCQGRRGDRRSDAARGAGLDPRPDADPRLPDPRPSGGRSRSAGHARQPPRTPSWTRRSYGFTDADMDRPIFIDNVLGLQVATDAADRRDREAHLLRHLCAAIHAHLRPRSRPPG